MQEGVQTNFDKLTRYRIRGDQEWLSIPEGLRTPRYAPGQDQHADQHILACSKLGMHSSNFPEPQPSKASVKEVQSHGPPPTQLPKPKPPAAAPAKISTGSSDKPKSRTGGAKAAHSPQPKPKASSAPVPVKTSADKPMSSAGGAKVNPRGLRQMLIGLGMAMEPSKDTVVDKSNASGSDYSETLKDTQWRNGGDEDDDELEDEENHETGGKCSIINRKGGTEEASDCSEDDASSGGGAAEVPARKLIDKREAKESAAQRSAEKRKGEQNRSIDTVKGAPGRPGKAQIEAVKALRTVIEEEILKLSKKFSANREALLGQLGMGGKERRKVTLLNLFAQMSSSYHLYDIVLAVPAQAFVSSL